MAAGVTMTAAPGDPTSTAIEPYTKHVVQDQRPNQEQNKSTWATILMFEELEIRQKARRIM